jgi:hypothetical protein
MIEKIVHTAKHTVKAKVLIPRAVFCCALVAPAGTAIHVPLDKRIQP